METSLIDLQDLAFNLSDGVHLAAPAGAWVAAVAGFGGLRDYGEPLTLAAPSVWAVGAARRLRSRPRRS